MGETAWSCWSSRCGRGGRYDAQSIGRGALARLLQRDQRAVVLRRVARRAASRSRPARRRAASAGGRRSSSDGGDRHRARGVLHPHHRPVVLLVDLDRGVGARRRRAADEQRDGEPLALHLRGDVDHLVQAGVIRPRQPDHVGADLAGGVEDLLGRHHHAEVDDLVVVALEHDADDVLADVVDVALDGRHHDRAVGVLGGGELGVVELLLLDERDQVGDGLLHHPRATSPPAAGTSCRRRTGRRRRSCRPSAGPRSPRSGGRRGRRSPAGAPRCRPRRARRCP